MMSPTTRIRTVRRRSSRLCTWLYRDGPLVPSWVARALIVSASQPSRSRNASAALTMESRLSLAGRRPEELVVAGRTAPEFCCSGRAAMGFALRVGRWTRDWVSEKLTPLGGAVALCACEQAKVADQRCGAHYSAPCKRLSARGQADTGGETLKLPGTAPERMWLNCNAHVAGSADNPNAVINVGVTG